MTLDRVFGAFRADRNSLRRMIVLSLLLHLAVLILSSLLPTARPPKAALSPNYMVDLVSSLDTGMKGQQDSRFGGPAKEPVEMPTAAGKAAPGRLEAPLPKPVRSVKEAKRPDLSAARAAEKNPKRVEAASRIPPKPIRAEKVKAQGPAKGDAIEKILARADSTRKAAPVPRPEKAGGATQADAIGEILKGADSPRRSPLKTVPQGAAKGSEASSGSAIDAIRKRVEAAEQRERAVLASSGGARGAGMAAGSGVAGITAGGSPSGTGGNAAFNARMYAYYRLIWARIKKQWTISPGLLPRENIGAVIHVRVLRNGDVEEIRFEKRSGNRYFDESALRAVRKASPFPPLPEGTGEGEVEMGIRFHASELR